MAYENLRAAIMQNIKTNNQEEITGAVMQQILLQMVSELGAWDSTLSGYATTQWVQEQLNGYVSQSALNNYLPLTGGTMTGTIACGVLDTGYYFLNNEGLEFSIGYAANYRKSVIIGFEEDEPIIKFAYRNGQLNGTEIKWGNVTSNAFVKRDGTSAQFLKADGSVDSNTYITASALTGYATQSWVTTQLGDYLPLTGGTISGDLTISGNVVATAYTVNIKHLYLVSGWQIQMVDRNDDNSTKIGFNSNNVLYLNKGMKFGGSVEATGFVKENGTSDQVLCADGSTKTLAQLKAALDAL